MKQLMTKQFSKWASRQQIPQNELTRALQEVKVGNFEANLGGQIYKKRIRFQVCYKKKDRIIFIHGFAKNEKSSLTKKELTGFKEFAQILLAFLPEEIEAAIKNGDFIEVKS